MATADRFAGAIGQFARMAQTVRVAEIEVNPTVGHVQFLQPAGRHVSGELVQNERILHSVKGWKVDQKSSEN